MGYADRRAPHDCALMGAPEAKICRELRAGNAGSSNEVGPASGMKENPAFRIMSHASSNGLALSAIVSLQRPPQIGFVIR